MNDILQNFQAALPHGDVTIIGDLSDTRNVLTALGVTQSEKIAYETHEKREKA